MKELRMSAHKDLFLSIIVLFFITMVYLFNLIPKNLETKENTNSSYIFTGKYNLQKITLQEINDLPNISDKLAIKIYNYKDKISKIDDFKEIKGIGNKKIEMLKKYIYIH
jgi:DNA uptake protein ComE-like DNA-binding protein